jgi:hypothetical protein
MTTVVTLVGVLELSSKYRYGITSRGAPIYLFRPYEESMPECIVGCSHRDTSRNQIALITVELSEMKPRGNLIRLFGVVGDPIAEKAALLKHYCPYRQDYESVPVPVDQERQDLDLEGWTTFHIDPPGCRDIDDAISYHPDKGWAITIADVAAAVPEGSTMDLTAKAIGSTFYDLEGRVMCPMLPPAISEGTSSLLPGERRRGLTLFLGTETFACTWITVKQSYTYESFVGSSLAALTDEEPHAWIEKQMIRYNKAAAAILKKAGTGILRVQGSEAKWVTIDPGIGEAARYEAVGEGEQTHASLGLYCHASSPLRRYADLVNQRAVKAILSQKEAPVTDVEFLNVRAKANRRWSRDLVFLTYVTAGRIHEIDVIWLEDTRVWVPLWRRVIRLRHEEPRELGSRGRIRIFCDPTRRNWKQRILTEKI